MCMRLLGAIAGAAPGLPALAFRCGLDLRAPAGSAVVELAWGDCACALATRADGGERVAQFAEALLAAGARFQLLLMDERDEPRFGEGEVPRLSLAALASLGLAALEQGTPVEVMAGDELAGEQRCAQATHLSSS